MWPSVIERQRENVRYLCRERDRARACDIPGPTVAETLETVLAMISENASLKEGANQLWFSKWMEKKLSE